MGNPYGPNLILPTPPTQYTNPFLTSGISNQAGLANQLTSGDFTGGLSWLQGLTNPNSGYLTNALSAAQGTLQPQFRDTLKQIQNSAAANGSLNSSTFTDALAKAGSDLNSQYQSMVGNAAMQDYTNANNNRLGLFNTGVQMGQQNIGNAANQSNTTNAFNLENYSNSVANAIQNNSNQSNTPTLQDLLKQFSQYGLNGANSNNNSTPLNAGTISSGMWGNSQNTATTPFNSPSSDLTFSAQQPGANTFSNTSSTGYAPYAAPSNGLTFSAPSNGLSFSQPGAFASNNPFSNTAPFNSSRVLDYLR